MSLPDRATAAVRALSTIRVRHRLETHSASRRQEPAIRLEAPMKETAITAAKSSRFRASTPTHRGPSRAVTIRATPARRLYRSITSATKSSCCRRAGRLYGPYTCSSDGNTWNWAVNPNGPVAQTPNNTGTGCHGFGTSGWDVRAPVPPGQPSYDGDGNWAYDVLQEPSGTDSILPLNATFSGYLGEGSPNSVDSHPTCFQCVANPSLNTWFEDARPFLGDSSLTSCPTVISGTLRKCTSARLRRKYLPTLAVVGHQQLSDMSRPQA